MDQVRRIAAFADRHDAGRQLAAVVAERGELTDPLVLALPRGGVPVAYEVARALAAPLEVFVSRKVGAPGHREFALGAIAEGASRPVFGPQVEQFDFRDDQLDRLVAGEVVEVERRVDEYRQGRPLPPLQERCVIVVDDGLATGSTAEAALLALDDKGSTELMLAVPVAARDTARRLREIAEVVTVSEPDGFGAVGSWYLDFDQISDDEVLRLLDESRSWAT